MKVLWMCYFLFLDTKRKTDIYTLFFIRVLLLYVTLGWNWQKIKKIKELKIILFLHPKIIGYILIHVEKISVCVVLCLVMMKMRLKIKNRSQKYYINRPTSKHGHNSTKYKMCFSITMLICTKQHLSNIWSTIHERVKQHGGWVEKKRCL